MGLFKKTEEQILKEERARIVKEGKKARKVLRKAKKEGILPPNSWQLYRAMRKAGLDI